MRAYIDGDILIFRCGFAAERNVWYLSVHDDEPEQYNYKKDAIERLNELLPNRRSRDPKEWRLWSERYLEPLNHALHNLRTTVDKILDDLALTEYDAEICLSGEGNYRNEVAKSRPYKGNRDKAHRPTYEGEIRDYIKSTWQTTVSEGEEADDVMGIGQCSTGPLDSVIVTLDKDLNMIPGLKYNWVSKDKYLISEEEAMYYFYKQLLTGDSTDNIPGLPKVGQKKAEAALWGKSLDDMWEVVIDMYRAKGGEKWQEYLKEQGQLLWIRREPGQMWEPPTLEEEEPEEWPQEELSLI